MDVDFLAGGGLLERGPDSDLAVPSVPAMLLASVVGPRVDALLEDYAFLRRVEARARLLSGRAVEAVDVEGPDGGILAELMAPEGEGELAAATDATRKRVRAAFRDVIDAGSIAVLERG